MYTLKMTTQHGAPLAFFCRNMSQILVELVTWDHDIPNIWKVIKFHGSKPPTSMLYLNRTCWAFGDMFPYFGEVVLRSP